VTTPYVTAFMQMTPQQQMEAMVKLLDDLEDRRFFSDFYGIPVHVRFRVLFDLYKSNQKGEEVLSNVLKCLHSNLNDPWDNGDEPLEVSWGTEGLNQICSDLITFASNESRPSLQPGLAELIVDIAALRR
ncbi:hypothetical protein PENTCL1PPCAC_2789, partial [Pristionchus entomophagus]